jgi:hypothetical protein
VVAGEAVEGEQVLLDFLQERRRLDSSVRSRSSASPTSWRAASPLSAVKSGRSSAASIGSCSAPVAGLHSGLRPTRSRTTLLDATARPFRSDRR